MSPPVHLVIEPKGDPIFRSLRGVLLTLFGLALVSGLGAAVAPGTHIDTLPAGKRTYTDVVVRSFNAVTVVITHSEGLASVPLRDLPADWQQRFDYDPKAEAAAIAATPARPVPAPRATPAVAPTQATSFDRLLEALGTLPKLQAEVDLRPRFFQQALYVKDQGYRPSCSVFAVVSALEFQNAELTGRPEKFSEEYLIWATRKVLGRIAPAPETPANATAPKDESTKDEGFALTDVVTALRTYGVPLLADMPNTIGSKMGAIAEPDAKLIAEARRVRQISVYRLPGYENQPIIAGLVHSLNAGVPPVIALKWPHSRSIRNGYLGRQQPVDGYAHAVAVVGYTCPSGLLEDTVFVFKNSWGVQWGQGGYGTVSYEYLLQNLLGGVVLNVQQSATVLPSHAAQ